MNQNTELPVIYVDYMQVGYATTFIVPVISQELKPGTLVILKGDGVDDKVAVVDQRFGSNFGEQVQVTLLSPEIKAFLIERHPHLKLLPTFQVD